MKTKFNYLLLAVAILMLFLINPLYATPPDTVWTKDILHMYPNEVIKILRSPDDSLLYAGFDDPGFIVVYNTFTGDSIRTIYPSFALSQFNDFALSNDGKFIAAAERINNEYSDTIVNTIISIYDQKSGVLIRNILGNNANVDGFKIFNFIEFTPDSRYIFANLSGRGWKDYKGVWHDSIPWTIVIDTADWQVKRAYQINTTGPLAISPANDFYALSITEENLDGRVELRNIQNDSIIRVLKDTTDKDVYFRIKFSQDSNYLLIMNHRYWYIWGSNQNSYFRKYRNLGPKDLLSYGFTKYPGIMNCIKEDTITNKYYFKFYDFIHETTLYEFEGWPNQLIYFKTNNRILFYSDYNLILLNIPWTPTTIKTDAEKPFSIKLTPNPAWDYIEINMPPLPPGEGRGEGIRIFDLLGVEITTLSLRATPPYQGGEIRIDVSSLPPGVYFVRVGNEVRKFVKL